MRLKTLSSKKKERRELVDLEFELRIPYVLVSSLLTFLFLPDVS